MPAIEGGTGIENQSNSSESWAFYVWHGSHTTIHNIRVCFVFHVILLKRLILYFTHGHVYGLKCYTVPGLWFNLLYPLFQLFTGNIERDDYIKTYIKLVVPRQSKLLKQ